MATITIEEAQTKLGELIHSLTPGEEVVITENDRPVATLALPRQTRRPDEAGMARKPRELGKMKGTVLSMERFDDPLEEFTEFK
jgi:antitoxin (DNA-binding transcriptional repressor) of toxin-antitoxin stability system